VMIVMNVRSGVDDDDGEFVGGRHDVTMQAHTVPAWSLARGVGPPSTPRCRRGPRAIVWLRVAKTCDATVGGAEECLSRSTTPGHHAALGRHECGRNAFRVLRKKLGSHHNCHRSEAYQVVAAARERHCAPC
jgi:hypothetical protein